MTIEMIGESGSIMITGEHINLFRLLALKGALNLEVNCGLRSRANLLASARSFGFTGRTKRQALAYIEDLYTQIEVQRAEEIAQARP